MYKNYVDVCPQCGGNLSEKDKDCPYCGINLIGLNFDWNKNETIEQEKEQQKMYVEKSNEFKLQTDFITHNQKFFKFNTKIIVGIVLTIVLLFIMSFVIYKLQNGALVNLFETSTIQNIKSKEDVEKHFAEFNKAPNVIKVTVPEIVDGEKIDEGQTDINGDTNKHLEYFVYFNKDKKATIVSEKYTTDTFSVNVAKRFKSEDMFYPASDIYRENISYSSNKYATTFSDEFLEVSEDFTSDGYIINYFVDETHYKIQKFASVKESVNVNNEKFYNDIVTDIYFIQSGNTDVEIVTVTKLNNTLTYISKAFTPNLECAYEIINRVQDFFAISVSTN